MLHAILALCLLLDPSSGKTSTRQGDLGPQTWGSMAISIIQRSPRGALYRTPLGVRGSPILPVDPTSDGWHVVARMGWSGSGFGSWDSGTVSGKIMYGAGDYGGLSGAYDVVYSIMPTLGGVPYAENVVYPHARRLVMSIDESWNITLDYYENNYQYDGGALYGWSAYLTNHGTLTGTIPIAEARPAPAGWWPSVQLVQWSGAYSLITPLTPFNAAKVFAQNWICEGFSDSFDSGVGGDWTQVGENDWQESAATTNGMNTSGTIDLPLGVEGEIYWSTEQTASGAVTTQLDFFNTNTFGTGGYEIRLGLHERLDWWTSQPVAFDSDLGHWK